MLRTLVLCLLPILGALPGVSGAQAPGDTDRVSFQGLLLDALGDPIQGLVGPVRLRVYDSASGGTLLYEETHATISVVDGVYTVDIAARTPATRLRSNIDPGRRRGDRIDEGVQVPRLVVAGDHDRETRLGVRGRILDARRHGRRP